MSEASSQPGDDKLGVAPDPKTGEVTDAQRVRISVPDRFGETAQYQDREVTAEELTVLAENMCRIDKITVSAERRLATVQYEGESFFENVALDFSAFWGMVPPAVLANPASARIVRQAFGQGARKRIGHAMRNAYYDVMKCCTDRAQQLALKNAIHRLTAEADSWGQPNGFDPLGVAGPKAWK